MGTPPLGIGILREFLSLHPAADTDSGAWDEWNEAVAALDALELSLATCKAALSGTQHVRDQYKAELARLIELKRALTEWLEPWADVHHPALRDALKIAECPTPQYHESHRYCPSCPWTDALQ